MIENVEFSRIKWLESQPYDLTDHEKVLWELCFYPNPEGIHDIEAKYRNFSRKLVAKLYHMEKETKNFSEKSCGILNT